LCRRFPKGKSFSCELCGKAATRQCDSCRCTFYWCGFALKSYRCMCYTSWIVFACGGFSSKEHQTVDGQGIHSKVCKMLAVLRAPVDEIGSEEDREKRDRITKANQRKLIEVTREEASKFLVMGQHELAVRLLCRWRYCCCFWYLCTRVCFGIV
jgi:hypothetical protein